MRVQAWLQIGVERRETLIEIPEAEFEEGKRWVAEDPGRRYMEDWLERYVRDWLQTQYGWGWSGAGLYNDFSVEEGGEAFPAYVVTGESSIPNTRAIRLGNVDKA